MNKYLSILFILFSTIAIAQVPLKWSNTIDTMQNQLFYSKTNITVTPNNKSAILYRNDSQLFDEVAFYDENGALVFKQNFANDSAYMYCVTTDQQNNIYVVGEKTRQGISIGNIIVKIDSAGNILWKRVWHQYVNPGVEYPVKCLVDHNNNIIVTGQTVSMPNANNDIYVISYSESGNLNWQYTYNYPVAMSLDVVTDMEIDKYNNVYIGGYTPDTVANYLSDFTIIKLNKHGIKQWVNKTGYTTLGGHSSTLRSFVLDNDGMAYACGFLHTPNMVGTLKSQFVMTKVDTTGHLVWHEESFVDSQATAEDIAIDKQGNIYVNIVSTIDSTYYDMIGFPQVDIVKSILRINKYSKNKDLIWAYTDTAPTYNIHTLKVMNNRVACYSISNNNSNVTLLDTAGVFIWEYVYAEPLMVTSGPRTEYLDMTNDALYSIFSSTYNRSQVYVVLNKYGFDSLVTTIKPITITNNNNCWFANNTLYFAKEYTGSIDLFDVNGKLVNTYMVNSANNKQIHANTSGLYFVRFTPKDANEYWEPKKIVVTD